MPARSTRLSGRSLLLHPFSPILTHSPRPTDRPPHLAPRSLAPHAVRTRLNDTRHRLDALKKRTGEQELELAKLRCDLDKSQATDRLQTALLAKANVGSAAVQADLNAAMSSNAAKILAMKLELKQTLGDRNNLTAQLGAHEDTICGHLKTLECLAAELQSEKTGRDADRLRRETEQQRHNAEAQHVARKHSSASIAHAVAIKTQEAAHAGAVAALKQEHEAAVAGVQEAWALKHGAAMQQAAETHADAVGQYRTEAADKIAATMAEMEATHEAALGVLALAHTEATGKAAAAHADTVNALRERGATEQAATEAQLRAAHEASMCAMEGGHQGEMEAAATAHTATLEAQRASATADQAAAVAEMWAQHEAALGALETEHTEATEAAAAEHSSNLEVLREGAARDQAVALADMQATHEASVADLERSMKGEHAEAMRAAVEAHGEHLAGLESQMKGEATQERSEAMATVQSSMRENHAAAMERTLATHADEMAALRAEAEARQSAAMGDLRRTHEEATVVRNERHVAMARDTAVHLAISQDLAVEEAEVSTRQECASEARAAAAAVDADRKVDAATARAELDALHAEKEAVERTAAAAFNDSSRLSKELDAVRHVAARLRLDNSDMGESLVALEKEVVEGDEEVRSLTFQCRILEETGEAQVERATAGRLAMATVSAVVQRGLGAVIHSNHAAAVCQMEKAHTAALAEATTAHEDAVSALKSQMEGDQNVVVQALRAAHTAAMDSVAAAREEDRAESFLEQHTLCSGHNSIVEAMSGEHAAAIEVMSCAHAAAVEEMKADHAAVLEEMSTTAVEAMTMTETDHALATESMVQGHATTVETMTQEHAAVFLGQHGVHAAQMGQASRAHEEAMRALKGEAESRQQSAVAVLQRKHGGVALSLNAQISDLEVNAAVLEAKVSVQEQVLASTEAHLSRVQGDHQAHLAAVAEAHQADTAAWQGAEAGLVRDVEAARVAAGEARAATETAAAGAAEREHRLQADLQRLGGTLEAQDRSLGSLRAEVHCLHSNLAENLEHKTWLEQQHAERVARMNMDHEALMTDADGLLRAVNLQSKAHQEEAQAQAARAEEASLSLSALEDSSKAERDAMSRAAEERFTALKGQEARLTVRLDALQTSAGQYELAVAEQRSEIGRQREALQQMESDHGRSLQHMGDEHAAESAAAVAKITVEKDGLRAELDSVHSLHAAGRASLVIERDAAKRELEDERKRTSRTLGEAKAVTENHSRREQQWEAKVKVVAASASDEKERAHLTVEGLLKRLERCERDYKAAASTQQKKHETQLTRLKKRLDKVTGRAASATEEKAGDGGVGGGVGAGAGGHLNEEEELALEARTRTAEEVNRQLAGTSGWENMCVCVFVYSSM